MKRMFAVLITVAMFGVASAQHQTNRQWNHGNNNDVVYNGNRQGNYGYGSNSYSFTTRERDIRVAEINREYDRKIREVSNRFFMARYKKERMIYALEEQRRDELRRVYAKFNDRNNRECGNNGRRF
jgi:L-2-hydroxyglutarate oxidase LhgO